MCPDTEEFVRRAVMRDRATALDQVLDRFGHANKAEVQRLWLGCRKRSLVQANPRSDKWAGRRKTGFSFDVGKDGRSNSRLSQW